MGERKEKKVSGCSSSDARTLKSHARLLHSKIPGQNLTLKKVEGSNFVLLIPSPSQSKKYRDALFFLFIG
jgi:hypothetical protein